MSRRRQRLFCELPNPDKTLPPWACESRWRIETTNLKGSSGKPAARYPVQGKVVGLHIDDAAINDSIVDMVQMQTHVRCGYMDCTTAGRVEYRNRSTKSATQPWRGWRMVAASADVQ